MFSVWILNDRVLNAWFKVSRTHFGIEMASTASCRNTASSRNFCSHCVHTTLWHIIHSIVTKWIINACNVHDHQPTKSRGHTSEEIKASRWADRPLPLQIQDEECDALSPASVEWGCERSLETQSQTKCRHPCHTEKINKLISVYKPLIHSTEQHTTASNRKQ